MGPTWKSWYLTKEGLVEPEVPRLERLMRKDHARRILDIGCGAGRHVLYFAKKGFDAYGFDNAAAVVAALRRRAKKQGFVVYLRSWSMFKPFPYNDGFFDAVMSTRVITHTYAKDAEHIFEELDRVLRPGGLVFLQIASLESTKRWKGDESDSKLVEPGTFVPLRGDEKGVPHHHFSRRELRALLKGYKILLVHEGKPHYHGYCIIARKPA